MRIAGMASLAAGAAALLLILLIKGCASAPAETGDTEGGISGTGHGEALCETQQREEDGRCREIR